MPLLSRVTGPAAAGRFKVLDRLRAGLQGGCNVSGRGTRQGRGGVRAATGLFSRTSPQGSSTRRWGSRGHYEALQSLNGPPRPRAPQQGAGPCRRWVRYRTGNRRHHQMTRLVTCLGPRGCGGLASNKGRKWRVEEGGDEGRGWAKRRKGDQPKGTLDARSSQLLHPIQAGHQASLSGGPRPPLSRPAPPRPVPYTN